MHEVTQLAASTTTNLFQCQKTIAALVDRIFGRDQMTTKVVDERQALVVVCKVQAEQESLVTAAEQLVFQLLHLQQVYIVVDLDTQLHTFHN